MGERAYIEKYVNCIRFLAVIFSNSCFLERLFGIHMSVMTTHYQTCRYSLYLHSITVPIIVINLRWGNYLFAFFIIVERFVSCGSHSIYIS